MSEASREGDAGDIAVAQIPGAQDPCKPAHSPYIMSLAIHIGWPRLLFGRTSFVSYLVSALFTYYLLLPALAHSLCRSLLDFAPNDALGVLARPEGHGLATVIENA